MAKKDNKKENIEKFEVVVNELPELKSLVFETEETDNILIVEPVEIRTEEIEEIKTKKRTVADLNQSELRVYQRTGFIAQ
jgi:hypothetical protein